MSVSNQGIYRFPTPTPDDPLFGSLATSPPNTETDNVVEMSELHPSPPSEGSMDFEYETLIDLSEEVEYEPKSHFLVSCFAIDYKLPENATTAPHASSLLGTTDAPGELALLIRDKMCTMSQDVQKKIEDLILSIQNNDNRELFSTNDDERKKEYALYCHKLKHALAPDAKVSASKIFKALAEIGEVCKTGWDQAFEEEILPIRASTIPAVFSLLNTLEFRRSLVPIMIARFFSSIKPLPDRAHEDYLRAAKELHDHIASPHYLKAAKHLLNEKLSLGYCKFEGSRKEARASFKPFLACKDKWEESVTQVLSEHESQENIEHALRQGFEMMSTDNQDALIANIVAIYEQLLKSDSVDPHPNMRETLTLDDKLMQAYTIGDPKLRWALLSQLKTEAFEFGIQLPIQTDEDITNKLERELKQQAMLALRGNFKQDDYLTHVRTLRRTDDTAPLFICLERFDRWQSEDHTELAYEWGYVPSKEVAQTFMTEIKKTHNLSLIQEELLSTKGGKRSLSEFGVYALLAISGDLFVEEDCHNEFLAETLDSIAWYRTPFVNLLLEKGMTANQIIAQSPPGFLSEDDMKRLVILDPKAYCALPEKLHEDKTFVLPILEQNPELYKYLPTCYKLDLEFGLLAASQTNNRDLALFILQRCPKAFKNLPVELQEEEKLAFIAMASDRANIKIASPNLQKSFKQKMDSVIEEAKKAVSGKEFYMHVCPDEFKGCYDVLALFPELEWNHFEECGIHTVLQFHPEVLKSILKKAPLNLQHLDDPLKSDRELLLVAIEANERALQFVPNNYQLDEAFLLDAIEKNAKVFECIQEPNIRRNIVFISQARARNPAVKNYLPEGGKRLRVGISSECDLKRSRES